MAEPANRIFVAWTIDCESTQRTIADNALGDRSIRGYTDFLESRGLKSTLFVLPGDAAVHAPLLRRLADRGFEIGLHFHPQEEGHDDFCGAYTADQQRSMYTDAIAKFADALGFRPTTFRTGSCSANDATFPVTRELGFTSCSHSMPGRNMIGLKSNWTGAPHHVHFAHPANRLLENGLDLVEIPVTTDPDSMLWSGVHPQDLRVELFDAKNQRFMIEKMLRREKARPVAVKVITTLTHNLFDFSNPADFRRQTLEQMVTDFGELAGRHEIELIPATIGDIAAVFREFGLDREERIIVTNTTPFTIREIPFGALGGTFEQDDVDAAMKVIGKAAAGGDFFPLPEEVNFQNALAAHEGAKHAVAVNSCGTALDLCMMALNIGPGDEVITTPLTFICTATCAIARGAKVVFADIDPATLCLDPVDVRRRISRRTKAIIPVHFAGLAADVSAFDRISAETGIPVVYDAAHAVSTHSQGRPIGGRGRASCYSFQSNKTMTTLGEGGAITTDDEAFAEIVRQKKTFGYVYAPKLRIPTVGFNYRLTKPQCAVGITQLAKVDRVVAARLQAFETMNAMLEGVPEMIRPAGVEAGHACHLYVARLDTNKVAFDRAAFLGILKGKYKVSCGNHYPAVWTWEALSVLGHNERDAACPFAARACEQVISLPLFPTTTAEDCAYIAWAIKQSLIEAGK